MNRRDLLVGATGALAAGGMQRRAADDAPFPYGVASGDPTSTSVVIWTALSSEIGAGTVEWRVRHADSEAVVRQGVVATDAASGWTAKVSVDGLQPDRSYTYEFSRAGAISPEGRTRTLPSAGARPVRFAVFSCSRYSSGWFHAYRHAAEDRSLDFAVHLGDFIYEGADSPNAALTGRRHVPSHELHSLSDYRRRHAQHKRDPDLQALHAALPMLAIWDDHEFADDASRDGADTSDPTLWPRRAAAARQAYFEWMPILPGVSGGVWRTKAIGDLADLYLLDTRIEGRAAHGDPGQPSFASSERQLLGPVQERWLTDALSAPARPWTLLMSSVILSPIAWPEALRDHMAADAPPWGRTLLEQRIARSTLGQAGNPDAWDGYPAAQARLMAALGGRSGRTLVLSGDTHSSWSFRLPGTAGPQPGWEVGVPSVTSEASLDAVPAGEGVVEALFKRRNPHLDYLDPSSRGYAVVELSRNEARVQWRHVSSVVTQSPTWRVGKQMTLR